MAFLAPESPPHLVVKVCFGSALRPQAKLAIGHLLSVVPETSSCHGQYQHDHCYGNEGDDRPARALGNLGYLRETPCVCPLGGERWERTVSRRPRGGCAPKVTRFTLTTHLFLYHCAWQRGLLSEQLVLSFKDRGLGSRGIMSHKPIKNTSQAAQRSVKHDAVTCHSVRVHLVFCSTVFTRALAVLPTCNRMLTETPCYFYFHQHTHSQPVPCSHRDK